LARRACRKWPQSGRQRPSSPAVQNVPGSIRLEPARIMAFGEFGGVFMKYPG